MTAALQPGGGPGVDADIPLSVSTVTLLTELVADELERRQFGRPRWVTADRVAEHLGVERDWVYAHAGELGGVPLGGGKRPRRRFRLDLIDERLIAQTRRLDGTASPAPRSSAGEPKRQHRRRTDLDSCMQLLPIRGDRSAR